MDILGSPEWDLRTPDGEQDHPLGHGEKTVDLLVIFISFFLNSMFVFVLSHEYIETILTHHL